MTQAKAVIASSYDTIASKYHAWASPRPTEDRAAFIARLSTSLPPKAKILELGCGSGVPATRQLVELGFRVTAVDVSSSLIDIAKKEVPGAQFLVGDMLTIEVDTSERFDCVMAFYTLWHLPPDEQRQVLVRAAKEWLKPGGYMLFNLMTVEGEVHMGDWMGAPMYSWGQGVEGNMLMTKSLVEDGLFEPRSEGDMTWQGVVKEEMVGKNAQGMHWFCLKTKA